MSRAHSREMQARRSRRLFSRLWILVALLWLLGVGYMIADTAQYRPEVVTEAWTWTVLLGPPFVVLILGAAVLALMGRD